MSFNKLLAKAVKDEGKKSSIKIHDARELLSILKRYCAHDPKNFVTLVKYLSPKG